MKKGLLCAMLAGCAFGAVGGGALIAHSERWQWVPSPHGVDVGVTTITASSGASSSGVPISIGGSIRNDIVFYNDNASFTVSSSDLTVPPQGAIFHQVVDRYYDAAGQEIETKSHTHAVGYDCHNGVRRDDPLIAQDDGHGGVRFVALLMGNEPTTGQKPLTAEGKVKVILAASDKGQPHDDAPVATADPTTKLAAR